MTQIFLRSGALMHRLPAGWQIFFKALIRLCERAHLILSVKARGPSSGLAQQLARCLKKPLVMWSQYE